MALTSYGKILSLLILQFLLFFLPLITLARLDIKFLCLEVGKIWIKLMGIEAFKDKKMVEGDGTHGSATLEKRKKMT